MQVFQKKPGENWPIQFDYTSRLPAGTTVSSGSCAAVDKKTGDTAAVITGGVTITTTSAKIRVTGGADKHDYIITMSVTLSDSSVLIDEAEMQVRA